MQQGGNLDILFQQNVTQLALQAMSQPRAAKLRIQAWLSKLREPTCNTVWKRNRNMYCSLLLAQLQQGSLDAPFTAVPPEGALPNLPNHLVYRVKSPSKSAVQPRSRSTSPPAASGMPPSPARTDSEVVNALHNHPSLAPGQLQGLVQTFHSNMQARGFDLSRAGGTKAHNVGRSAGSKQEAGAGVVFSGSQLRRTAPSSGLHSGGSAVSAPSQPSGGVRQGKAFGVPDAPVDTTNRDGGSDGALLMLQRDQQRVSRVMKDALLPTDGDDACMDQDATAAALLAAKEAEIAERVAVRRRQEHELRQQAENAALARHMQRTAEAKAHMDAVILRYNSARQQWTSPIIGSGAGSAYNDNADAGHGSAGWSPAKAASSEMWADAPASPGALKLLPHPQDSRSGVRPRQGSGQTRMALSDAAVASSSGAGSHENDAFQPWGSPTLRLSPPRKVAVVQQHSDGSPTRADPLGWSTMRPPGQVFLAPGCNGNHGPSSALRTTFGGGNMAAMQPAGELLASSQHAGLQHSPPRNPDSPSRWTGSKSRGSSPGASPCKQWPSPDPAIAYSVARKMRSTPRALQVISRATAGQASDSPGGTGASPGSLLVPLPLVAQVLRPGRAQAKFEFSNLMPSLAPPAKWDEGLRAASPSNDQDSLRPSAARTSIAAAAPVEIPDDGHSGHSTAYAFEATNTSHDEFESSGSSRRSSSPQAPAFRQHPDGPLAGTSGNVAPVRSPHKAQPAPLTLRLASPPASPRQNAPEDGGQAQLRRQSSLPGGAYSAIPTYRQPSRSSCMGARSAERLRRATPSSTSSWSRPSSVPPSSRSLGDPPVAPAALRRRDTGSAGLPCQMSGSERERSRPSHSSSQPSSLTGYPASTLSIPSSTQLTEMARRSLAASLPEDLRQHSGSSGPFAHFNSSSTRRTSTGNGSGGHSSQPEGTGGGARSTAMGTSAEAELAHDGSRTVDLSPPIAKAHGHQLLVQETPKLVRRPSALASSARASVPSDPSRRASSADIRSALRSLETFRDSAPFRSRRASAEGRPPSNAADRRSASVLTANESRGLSELSGAETAVGELTSLDVDGVIQDFERSLQDNFEFSLRPTPPRGNDRHTSRDASPGEQFTSAPHVSRSSSFPSTATRLADRFALHSALAEFRLAFDRLKRRLALHSTDPTVAEAIYGASSSLESSRYRSPPSGAEAGPAAPMPLPAWRPPGSSRSASADRSFRGSRTTAPSGAAASRSRQTEAAERFCRVAAKAVSNYQDDVALLLSRVRTVLQPGGRSQSPRPLAVQRDARLRQELEALAVEAAAVTVREIEMRRGVVAEVLQTLEESAHQLGLQLVTLAAAPMDLAGSFLAQLASRLRDQRDARGPRQRADPLRPTPDGTSGNSSDRSAGLSVRVAGGATVTGSEPVSSVGATAAWDSAEFELQALSDLQITTRRKDDTSEWLGDMPTPTGRPEQHDTDHSRQLSDDRDRAGANTQGPAPTSAGAGRSGPGQGSAPSGSSRHGCDSTGPFGRHFIPLGSAAIGPGAAHQASSAPQPSVQQSRPPAGSASVPPSSQNSAPVSHVSSLPSSMMEQFAGAGGQGLGVDVDMGDWHASLTAYLLTQEARAAREAAQTAAREAAAAAERQAAQAEAIEAAVTAVREAADTTSREAAAAAAERQAAQAAAHEAAQVAAREAAQASVLELAEVAERQFAQVTAREAAHSSVLEAAVNAVREAAQATARDAALAAAARQAAVREAAQVTASEAAVAAEREAAQEAAREAATERQAAQAAALEAAQVAAQAAAQAAAKEAAVTAAREASQAAAREAAMAAREAAQAAAREAVQEAAREAVSAASREAAILAAREAAQATAREAAAVAAAREAAQATAREAEAAVIAREAAQAAAREATAAAERQAAQAAEREAAQLAALEAAVAAAREAAESAREAAHAATQEAAQASAREAVKAAERSAAQTAALDEAVAAARQAAQSIALEVAAVAEREAAAQAAREAAVAAALEAAAAAERLAAEAAEREAAAAMALQAAVAAAKDAAVATAQETARQAAEAAAKEAAAAAERDLAAAAAREAAAVAAARGVAEATARKAAAASEAAKTAAREAAAAAKRHAAKVAEQEAAHVSMLKATLATAHEAALITAREVAQEAAKEAAAASRETTRAAELLAAHVAEREEAHVRMVEAAREAALTTAREAAAAAERLVADAAVREAAVSAREVAVATSRETVLATLEEVTAATIRQVAEREKLSASARRVAVAAAREAAAEAAQEAAIATAERQVAQAAAVAAEAASAVAVAQTTRMESSRYIPGLQQQAFSPVPYPGYAGVDMDEMCDDSNAPVHAPAGPVAFPAPHAPPSVAQTPLATAPVHNPRVLGSPGDGQLPQALAYRALVWEVSPTGQASADTGLAQKGSHAHRTTSPVAAVTVQAPGNAPGAQLVSDDGYAAAAAVAAVAAAIDASPAPSAPPVSGPGIHRHQGNPAATAPRDAELAYLRPDGATLEGGTAPWHEGHGERPTALNETVETETEERVKRVGFLDISSSAELSLELFRQRRQQLAASPPLRPRPYSVAATPSSAGVDVPRRPNPSTSARPHTVGRAVGPSEVLSAIRSAAAATAAAMLDADARREYQEFQQVKRQLGLVDLSPPGLRVPATLPPPPPEPRSSPAVAPRAGPPHSSDAKLRGSPSVQPSEQDSFTRTARPRLGDGSMTQREVKEARELTRRLQRLADRTTQLQQRVELMARPAVLPERR